MKARRSDPGTTPHQAGKEAETYAIDYLKSMGLLVVCRNYHSKYGEIDLVMQHDEILVFIEVRHRNNDRYMDPLESIDTRKIRKITRTAQDYLQKNITSPCHCRFDIITLTGSLDKPAINWIQNAFDANV